MDIVIGTHKLLPNVKFDRLGLVIIDEEHRFGVRQKEAMKNLRAEVDILTLTATPIRAHWVWRWKGDARPVGDCHRATKTAWRSNLPLRREEKSVIREAVLRELKRGGQVYFLHNEVATIENRREMLAELIPEARIVIAHGQMHERDLERVMRDFIMAVRIFCCAHTSSKPVLTYRMRTPSSRTVRTNSASRSYTRRAGASGDHHQAYAYLLIHHEDALTTQAERRWKPFNKWKNSAPAFPRHAGHGDSRRRRNSRRKTIGQHHRNRLLTLQRHAQRRDQIAQARQRTDLSAPPGASPPRSICTRPRYCPMNTAAAP